jgi:hypothetical protein
MGVLSRGTTVKAVEQSVGPKTHKAHRHSTGAVQ